MGLLNRIFGGGDAVVARARRPQELAARRRRPALEGLQWLGRRPSPRAGLAYRIIVRFGELVLLRVSEIQVNVEGREHLPPGGYLLAAALHRNWIDPLVVLRALPREPRSWFMGGAPTAFDRAWKEWLLHRIGGFLPIWRGGSDVAVHVDAARAVIEEGAVLVLFFEGGVAGPADRVNAQIRSGSGLLALRTDARIVPFALAGSNELYRGKRIHARILPPVTVAGLLGDRPEHTAELDTRGELRLARQLTRALADVIDSHVPELAQRSADPPDHPRRWRWLNRLFL